MLKGIGAAAAAAVASPVATTRAAAAAEWTVAETPTDGTLHDAVYIAAGVYAVGGGLVLERIADGRRTVVDGGPTGNGNTLYAASVTDDGRRLWFVGAVIERS
jgi:hypothetical protein